MAHSEDCFDNPLSTLRSLVMYVFCNRCQKSGHAEEWHTFKYRRWWVKFQRGFKEGKNMEHLLEAPDVDSKREKYSIKFPDGTIWYG